MRVLSLFDGISCGRIALDRAGISVEKYYSSEIDKYAISVSSANWPLIEQLGDVKNWREWDIDWSSIDLIIGGSPCQGFSFAGKQLAFDDPRSSLFFDYLDIVSHARSFNSGVKFMLENVRMKQESRDVITEFLNVEPLMINSSLVSAQNRVRYYWSNWDFNHPSDKKILLEHILDTALPSDDIGIRVRDKSKCVRVVGRGSPIDSRHVWDSPYIKCDKTPTIKRKQKKASCLTGGAHSGGNHSDMDIMVIQTAHGFNKGGFRGKDGKTPTITSSSWEHNNKILQDGVVRRFSVNECEKLQTVPVDYTNHASNSQRYKMLGNCWTVDVVAHILQCLKNELK